MAVRPLEMYRPKRVSYSLVYDQNWQNIASLFRVDVKKSCSGFDLVTVSKLFSAFLEKIFKGTGNSIDEIIYK